MRVFVTGASGFVGGRVVETLASQGHEVLAMARSEGAARKVAARGATPVRCSLEQVAARDLGGASVVIHCAAYVEEWGPAETYHQVNVEGTRNLLLAAEHGGVERFLHVSTVGAVWDGGDMVDLDETAAYPARHRFPYTETKAAAERLVQAANRPGFETVAVRPCLIWGEGDTTVLPVLHKMVSQGAFTWLDGGRARLSTTHVDNLVHGILLALERGQGGRAYFVRDDQDHSIREFLTAYAATDGLALPDRSLPGWLVRGAAAGIEGLWKLSGKTAAPPVTGFAAAASSRSLTVRHDLAARELGYAPVVTVAQGMAAMV